MGQNREKKLRQKNKDLRNLLAAEKLLTTQTLKLLDESRKLLNKMKERWKPMERDELDQEFAGMKVFPYSIYDFLKEKGIFCVKDTTD